MNFLKGETTVERYGRKPKGRLRMPLLESPKRKLNIEFTQMFENNENRNCFGNCINMMCSFNLKS